MHTDDDEGSPPLFTANMINVDVRGLDDFAQLLREEIDANFVPTKDEVVAEHSLGVGFGARHASRDMVLARQKYRDCLHIAMQNLTTYVNASEILIAAARKVAAAYRDVDALSAAKVAEVDKALNDAVAEAGRVQERADLERRRAHVSHGELL